VYVLSTTVGGTGGRLHDRSSSEDSQNWAKLSDGGGGTAGGRELALAGGGACHATRSAAALCAGHGTVLGPGPFRHVAHLHVDARR
jgi:hypothetical protein